MHLMRELNEGDLWHRADDAWQAALLPRQALVRRKADGFTAFVVKAYSVAAVVWPAVQQGVGLWEEDQAASSLVWVIVLSLADFEVLPTAFASPLRLFLEDSSPAGLCGTDAHVRMCQRH